jgi:hypothetical protein
MYPFPKNNSDYRVSFQAKFDACRISSVAFCLNSYLTHDGAAARAWLKNAVDAAGSIYHPEIRARAFALVFAAKEVVNG